MHTTGYKCGTQYSTELFNNLPSYPPQLIIAQMSIGGEGVQIKLQHASVYTP